MSQSNPDNQKPKPVQNPTLYKLPKNQGAYDKEMDLWNLEDDDSSTTPGVTPVTEISALEKTEDAATKQTQDKSLTQDEESRPFAETDEDMHVALSEDDKSALKRNISVHSIEIKLSNPTESKYALPSRLAVAATEDEIWGDFTNEIASQAGSAEKFNEEEIAPVLTKNDAETPQSIAVTNITPVPEKPVLVAVTTEEEKPEPAPEKMLDPEKIESVASSELENTPDPAPEITATPSIQFTKFSPTEAIASVAFLLIIIVGAFFIISSYRANLTEKKTYAKPDYPVKGQIAEVVRAVTYWRPPIKDGPNRDPIKLDVKLLPVIEITLGSEATQGALRVMFHNEKGDIVGDTVTQNFTEGKFTLSAEETRVFSSTAGFVDFGEQEAYRAGLGKPWTIKVYEGPSDNTSSDQFRLLFTTPIDTERR